MRQDDQRRTGISTAKKAAFNAKYIEQTKTAYGAPLELLDFKNAFDPSRTHINVADPTAK